MKLLDFLLFNLLLNRMLFHLELVRHHLFDLEHLFGALLLRSQVLPSLHLHSDKLPGFVHHLVLRESKFFPLWLWLQLQRILVKSVKPLSVVLKHEIIILRGG